MKIDNIETKCESYSAAYFNGDLLRQLRKKMVKAVP